MKPDGYYTSGQFAKMARISVRTVRFYDKQNILKPSYVSPAGSRFLYREGLRPAPADPAAEISGVFPGRYPGNDH